MVNATIPVLETERLRLREHRLSDLPDCVAMWADPEVTRFISGKPSTPQQTWMRLLQYLGHWSVMRFGYWVIEERDSKEFVGEVGLADFKRDIVASMQGNPELGFAIAPRFHGRGYATEAAQNVLRWADVCLPYAKTVCLINPRNAASMRVVQKCGYEVFDEGAYNEQPTLFLARAKQGREAV